jgi:hypothetical protein
LRARTFRAFEIRMPVVAACAVAVALAAGVPTAAAESGGVGPDAGRDQATVAGKRAKLVRGKAIAPAAAPWRVKRAIRAANRIVAGKPYCYGGGHARWQSRCYDCSGTVSYALGRPGGKLLDAPMPSGSFMSWGAPGKGRWITVYANGGHMYAVIAGLRLDTSQTPGAGPGWSRTRLHQPGFRVRHPRGL